MQSTSDAVVRWLGETASDVSNYTKWFPVEHQHQVAQMPPISLWDLSHAVWCAIGISLVRYFVVQPLYTHLAIRTIPLSRRSLREVNDQRPVDSLDRIPDFVFPLLGQFLEAQAALMKAAKKSGRPDVAIDGKMRTQRQWKEVEKRILAQLPQTSGGVHYSEEDVRRWLSAYQSDASRSLKLKKFQEAGWHFTFYLFIWIFGLIVISDKEYFTQSVHLVWKNYPLQPPSADVTWYYWLSMGHYIHLFCASFFDIKRKDFVEMTIHHVVTLLLLSFSWMVNFSRIGALVLAVHDGCDVFLQLAKLFNYMHYRTVTDLTFVAFAVCFFVCRLVIFPGRIIYSSLVWTVTEGGYKPWFVYYFFNGLLLALQLLHLIWYRHTRAHAHTRVSLSLPHLTRPVPSALLRFSIIFRMALRWLTTGEMKKDARSDTDDGSASENEGRATQDGALGGADKGRDGQKGRGKKEL